MSSSLNLFDWEPFLLNFIIFINLLIQNYKLVINKYLIKLVLVFLLIQVN